MPGDPGEHRCMHCGYVGDGGKLDNAADERADKPRRCRVCDWPLAMDERGCTPRSCAYRPRYGSDEHTRIQRRREALARGEDPNTAPFPDERLRSLGAEAARQIAELNQQLAEAEEQRDEALGKGAPLAPGSVHERAAAILGRSHLAALMADGLQVVEASEVEALDRKIAELEGVLEAERRDRKEERTCDMCGTPALDFRCDERGDVCIVCVYGDAETQRSAKLRAYRDAAALDSHLALAMTWGRELSDAVDRLAHERDVYMEAHRVAVAERNERDTLAAMVRRAARALEKTDAREARNLVEELDGLTEAP